MPAYTGALQGALAFPSYSGIDGFLGTAEMLGLHSKPSEQAEKAGEASSVAAKAQAALWVAVKGVARLVAMVALPFFIAYGIMYNLICGTAKVLLAALDIYKQEAGKQHSIVDEHEALSQAGQHFACVAVDATTGVLYGTVILPLLYFLVPKMLEDTYARIHARIVDTRIIAP